MDRATGGSSARDPTRRFGGFTRADEPPVAHVLRVPSPFSSLYSPTCQVRPTRAGRRSSRPRASWAAPANPANRALGKIGTFRLIFFSRATDKNHGIVPICLVVRVAERDDGSR